VSVVPQSVCNVLSDWTSWRNVRLSDTVLEHIAKDFRSISTL